MTNDNECNSVISNMTIAEILDAIHNVYTKDKCLQIEKELNALLRFEPVRRKIIYDNSSILQQYEMNFELLPQWEKDYIRHKIGSITLQKRCPYRYFNHLASPNTSAMWDNRCKLDEGHKGEHVEAGLVVPFSTQTNTLTRTGWVKID